MQAEIIFGLSGVSAGNGAYLILLPVAAAAGVFTDRLVGDGSIRDSSASQHYPVEFLRYDSTHAFMRYAGGFGTIDHDDPWVWAASDRIHINLTYEAA